MSRFAYVMLTYFTVLAIAGLSFVSITPKLIWNASASVPIGLYSIGRADHLSVDDLVAVDPPEPLAEFMVERGYIARGAPLMKRVTALPRQEICRRRRTITVDGVELGAALDRDRAGRDLPVWSGCRRIADGEIFLMNPAIRDSLDGRYFGPLPAASVLGRATPIYTDEDGQGRFVWRAATR